MDAKYSLIEVPDQDDLNETAREVCSYFEESMGWYAINKKWKKRGSKIIRIASVFFFIIGSSIPFLDFLVLGDNTLELGSFQIGANTGYLSFAIAGFLFSLDKLFSFSSSWMRYITTELELEDTWYRFEQKWAALVLDFQDKCAKSEQTDICVLYDALYDFKIEVHSIIDKETKQWIAEFKSNLAEFEKLVKSKAEELKPGSLFVSITNATALTNIKIQVAGKSKTLAGETGHLFKNLKPDTYMINITANKDGSPVSASQDITIAAGQLSKTNITVE